MYIIIGLAIIGLFSFLIKEPSRLLTTLVTTAVIGFIIFIIARALIRGETFSSSSNKEEMRKYRQAVKQSQKRYNMQSKNVPTNSFHSKRGRKSRRRATHLTVIEGKKSLKKNNNDRASN